MYEKFLLLLQDTYATHKEYTSVLKDMSQPVHKMPEAVINELKDMIKNLEEDIVVKFIDAFMLPVCTDNYVHGFLVWNNATKLWDFNVIEQGDQVILKERLEKLLKSLLIDLNIADQFKNWWPYFANITEETIHQAMDIRTDYNFYCQTRLRKFNTHEYCISGTHGRVYERAGPDGVIKSRPRTWHDMYSYEIIDTFEFQQDNYHLMLKMTSMFKSFPKLVEYLRALVFKMANHIIIQCSRNVHKFIAFLIDHLFYHPNSMPFTICDTIENVIKVSADHDDEEDDEDDVPLMSRKYIHMKGIRFLFNHQSVEKNTLLKVVDEACRYGSPIITMCQDATGLESEISVRYDMQDVILNEQLKDYVEMIKTIQFKTELWKLLLK